MKNKPKIPYAFPCQADAGQWGMTLRDYFAAAALQGLLGNPQIAKDMVKEGIGPAANQLWHAETCYAFADALLKERAK